MARWKRVEPVTVPEVRKRLLERLNWWARKHRVIFSDDPRTRDDNPWQRRAEDLEAGLDVTVEGWRLKHVAADVDPHRSYTITAAGDIIPVE